MQFRSTCHVPCRRHVALAGTLQTQINAPPLLPIPACHTFDLAAGGLRNPRSSSAAQPLWSTCCWCCKARRLVVNTYSAECVPVCPHPHPRPAPAPPRLASCFPWRHGACSPNLSVPCPPPTAHRPRRRLSSVRWPSPHSPAQRSLSEKGPRRANARQVYCDTRILMLVCPASAESLSQTYPCAWRTMALALWLADASPEYQVFPVLSLILILILLMLLAARSLCAACGLLAHNILASPIDLVDISPLRPPIVSSSLNSKPSHSFLGAIPFFSSRVFNS